MKSVKEVNPYYKATMNYKQLASDLEKQGLRCNYDDKLGSSQVAQKTLDRSIN